jgi:replication factor C small subunit
MVLDLPWVEKYRPHALKDVIGQKLIVGRLKSFVEMGNFPSMIFAGSPGIGKTVCAVAMANDLYGEGNIRSAFLELNASDARGIDVIRETVKEFAKTISMAKVPVKIIFLDEADALTSDAQHALRRTMENYPATRFILSANYGSKIIEPIQSRCVVFRFRPLTEADMREYVKRVTDAERLDLDAKAVDALIYVGDGDLRRLTNVLQSAAMQNRKVTETTIYDTAARARPKEIISMLKYAISEDFANARDELDNLMLRNGMSAEDILTQCYREVQNMAIDEHLKLEIIKDIGEYNFRIVEGANERIQLEAMLAGLALAAKRNK